MKIFIAFLFSLLVLSVPVRAAPTTYYESITLVCVHSSFLLGTTTVFYENPIDLELFNCPVDQQLKHVYRSKDFMPNYIIEESRIIEGVFRSEQECKFHNANYNLHFSAQLPSTGEIYHTHCSAVTYNPVFPQIFDKTKTRIIEASL